MPSPPTKKCHLDRSAAEWRDLRFSLRAFSSLIVLVALYAPNASAQTPAAAQPTVQTETAPAPTVSAPILPMPPIASYVPAPQTEAPEVSRISNSTAATRRIAPTGLTPNFLGFLGPYRRPSVPPLFPGNGSRLNSLVRDGKLYITLHDAIALAIENNLDVEVERYNIVLADTDLRRAAGGGSTRGIDFTVERPENGVGGPGSPLLNTTAVNTNPVTPTVTDLTSLNSSTQAQQNLSVNGTATTYSPGPNIPLYDPNLIVESGYLRRSNTATLTSTTGTDATGATTETGALNFVSANVAYLQGFSTGTQIEATANNSSAVVYGSASQLDPFATLSTSTTITQPLLRGRGRDVNLRYLRIANLNKKVSRLLFEQQLLETIYGTSRLYFDLVSLGENVAVKQEALRAAQKLESDDSAQVEQGTLAPIELTRARALLGSSQYDLIQAQGLYRQQEVILRNELIRSGSPVFSASFTEIVPTDRILVPDRLDPMDVSALIQQGLARRPDLAQANLQIKTGEISVKASRNQALPQLNVYANAETRGSSEQAYEPLGTPPGTGQLTLPQNLALGGLRTSTIYQAGIQLTLPLRNRIAQSDAARDTVQLRQAQARTEKLSDQIRESIENAVIALETAQAAYEAATTSRSYQEQLLQSERDKLTVGSSTNLLVIQNETYLAQARSTEIAARSNWKKAQIDLDHALGNLLERNNISLDDAICGSVNGTPKP